MKEEMRLASDQAADQERRLEVVEREAARKHRTSGLLFRDRVNEANDREWEWRLQVDERKSS